MLGARQQVDNEIQCVLYAPYLCSHVFPFRDGIDLPGEQYSDPVSVLRHPAGHTNNNVIIEFDLNLQINCFDCSTNFSK